MDKVFVVVGFPLSIDMVKMVIENRWGEEIDRIVDLREFTKDALYDAMENQCDIFTAQERVNEKIEKAIAHSGNTLVFGQNHTPQSRLYIMQTIRKYGKSAYIVIDCPDIELIKSRYPSSREYITSVVRHFTIPIPSEFDDITFVYHSYCDRMDDLIRRSQRYHIKSNHHDETIYQHGTEVRKMMEEKGYKDNYLLSAIQLHDLGKIDTQSVDKNGAYHYYGHPNAGSYRLITHFTEAAKKKVYDGDPETDKKIYIAVATVCHHMAPYDWETEGQRLYNKRIYGTELWKILLDLNAADRACSLRDD